MKSEAAKAAAAIRKELKAAFPGEKMSVTSDNYAGGDAIRVSIGGRLPMTEGLSVDKTTPEYAMREKVRAIADKYQYGSFDGMTDLYSNTNKNDDLPQAKYVQVSAYS